MDVLWFSHLVPYPPKSGALLRAYYLLRAVAARHSVDLLAFVQEPLLASFYPDLDAALSDCRQHLQPICRSVTLLPIAKLKRPFGKYLTAAESLFTRDGYMAGWLRSREAARALRHLTSARHYAIAHFDFVGLAPYRSILGSTPTTLGHHNAETHMLLRRAANETSALRKLYFLQESRRLARFERRIANQFVTHITCSNLDSERLKEVMPTARFRTIPNGVDVEYFAPIGSALRPNSLVFVSSMNWYPNVDAALFLLNEIWPRVKLRRPTATLDIVGSNAPPSVVTSARLRSDVTLHGYVPDIRPIVDSAALYVCPVRDGGGTKLKVLDALAMGKCLVAHPVACEGIATTDGGDVVLAESADDFSERICELFDDPERRARIGAAGRALATTSYSFASVGMEFARLLETLAGTP